MPADRLGKDGFFEIAALADQIFYVVAVRHACDVLLDDWAVIENGGRIVRGGANEFHAARGGLMVGLTAGEGRKKRVMDIDHRATAA